MKKKSIEIIKSVLFLGIALYISIFFNDSLANLVRKAPTGWVLSSIVLRIIISLSFARGFQLAVKVLRPKIKSFLIFIAATLIGFGISFSFQPIYNTDYGNFGTTKKSINIDNLKLETNQEFNLNGSNSIITFFTTDCSHCMEASKRLGYAQSIGNTPQIIALFPGNIDDTENFLDKNNGQHYKIHIIDNDTFFGETAGGSFPSIFLVDKNGATIQHWFGDGLNYSALDLIEKYK
jgi:thioredoxin-related protein